VGTTRSLPSWPPSNGGAMTTHCLCSCGPTAPPSTAIAASRRETRIWPRRRNR
jgi:hypothetical protein